MFSEKVMVVATWTTLVILELIHASKLDFAEGLSLTYLPRKAVAEVSKDKEPIGREYAEFNWFESQLMSDSNEVRFK